MILSTALALPELFPIVIVKPVRFITVNDLTVVGANIPFKTVAEVNLTIEVPVTFKAFTIPELESVLIFENFKLQ